MIQTFSQERDNVMHTSQRNKPRQAEKQEEKERRILYGLSCEWDEALTVLNASQRKSIRPPLFSLRDMKKTWGTWDGRKREISLSRYLVLRHSWDSVREVLLHEMAHQFAEEVLGGDGESPHGPSFQRACFLLRANPKASGRYRPLDERISTDPSEPENRAIQKVKKLMALAESPNQHEAEIAMARAHELIEKFNLEQFSSEKPRRFTSIYLGSPALRHFREEYLLALLLQDFYFVRGIWVPAFAMKKGKMGRVLEISGSLQNVKIAAYVHDFVRNFIELKWTDYNKHKGLNRYRKSDFAAGILEGFRSKLENMGTEKNAPQNGKGALIKTGDPLLTHYFAYRYPRTSTIQSRTSSQDRKVMRDGHEEGKSLVIHKGVVSRGNRLRRLIGN